MADSNRRRLMRPHGFLRNSSAATALMFAIMAIPVLGVIGLAIDVGMWNEDYATLELAADSAALNAAKTAASAKAQGDANYLAEGTTSGTQWFESELGQGAYAATVTKATPTVNVTLNGAVVTATVSFNSTMRSIFGRLFKVASYSIGVSAAATMQSVTYTEVILFMDTSSSMGIGAGTADMQTLMQNSACDPSNEFTTTDGTNYSQLDGEKYEVYQYKWAGATYDGLITHPVKSGSLSFVPAIAETTEAQMAAYCGPAQVSGGYCKKLEQCPTQANGYPAYAGPPCAFACHWDNSKKAGLGKDLWAMARKLGVTLRLDNLKAAASLAVTAMQSDNIAALNNLSVGIYTFDTAIHPIYPGPSCTPQAPGCEAGSQWSTALSAIGAAPKPGSGIYTDTGIQPTVATVGGNNDNTEIEEAMAGLPSTYVTAAGNGATSTSPKKVLILLTDGFEDDPTGPGYNGLRQAMPSSACTPFKTLGYTVYVIYMPYYPLMHTWYLANAVPIAEGTGPDSIVANLQACATNPEDYIAATDQNSLNNALLTFLTEALYTPATFTK
jgi:Flp pilus assembly protein TadG